MNRSWVARLILATIGILVGSVVGAALGRLDTGIAFGVGLGILMTLPTVSFYEPASEFYLLKLFWPEGRQDILDYRRAVHLSLSSGFRYRVGLRNIQN